MKYELNITDNYAKMIHFDEMIGLNHFIRLPVLESELSSSYEICLENIAINLDSDEQPYQDLLKINPDSFVKGLTDPVVVLKKAKLKIDRVKCCTIEMDYKEDSFFHSWKTAFEKNDFYIFCYANSLDYPDAFTYVKLIFSGCVSLLFNDDDMFLHTIKYDVCINKETIKRMNEEQDIKIRANTKNNIYDLKVNNIKSKLWNYDYFNLYFQRNYHNLRYEAIKDYDGTDE